MKPTLSSPRSADLEITSRCNARCRYCYFYHNDGVGYSDLPTQTWLDFLAELGEAKVMYVTLAGGEPLLREDIFDLIEGIVRNRMRFELLTNGWPVNRDVARRLKQTGRCYSVEVTLDGSTAAVHESMRGEGSFRPAVEAIQILQEEGLPVTVRVNVHAQNVDDLPAIVGLLLDELKLRFIRTAGVSSVGTKEKYPADVFPTASQRLRAMRLLAELDAQYPRRIQASSGPLAQWRLFRAMEEARESGASLPGGGFLSGCGCVLLRVSVRCDGAYVPCVLLPQMVAGYIGQDRLEDVWQDSPVLHEIRSRIHMSMDSFSECQGCAYVALCTGSCAAGALSLLEDARRPNPEECLRQFKEELASAGITPW